MLSSPYGVLLFALPNLFVGLAYLAFLKRPLRVRVMAALPSVLFLLVFAIGFGLGPAAYSSPVVERVLPVALRILGTVAMLFVIGILVRIRTWLNLLQVINVPAGLLIVYIVTAMLAGDLS